MDHQNVALFTMHDLVHDLARSVMVDEILVSSKQDNNSESSYRYALLNDSSKPLKSFTEFHTKLRALRFVDCTKAGLRDDAFSGVKYLRVLDLSEYSVQKLPCSIGQLRQLRYLSAPGIKDTMVPDCIAKLSKLLYLNLSGSSQLLSLPESIGEMDSLMHLDLSGCSGIQRVPQSFGKLKLSYLDLSNCSSLKGVSEYLGNLSKLQHLDLSYCQYVEKLGNLGSLTELQYFHFSTSSCSPGLSQTDVLGTFTKLEYLNLSTEFTDIKIKRLPDAMGSFIKLEYLDLSRWRELEELPKSWGSLKNLIHLDLSKCFKIKGVPEALSNLTKLQYLNLSWCSSNCSRNQSPLRDLEEVVAKLTELRNLNLSGCLNTLQEGEIEAEVVCQNFLASVCSLSNLEELDLSHNYRIKTLPESIGDLRKLHTLTLRRCLGLSQLPRALREIDNLKHLNIADCFLDMSTVPKSNSSLILLPRFAVQALDDGSGSNLVLLQNVNRATTLEINKLENVVTVREAQRVRLKEKEMILELALCWTRDARRLLDDQILLGELEPPRNLSKFQLRGYNSVAFPDWLMNIAPHNFPSLSRIYLVDLPKCTCLPPLGQLPQLEILSLDGMNGITKIDGEFCGGAGAFPSLKNLYISNMESLEEWQTKYSCSEGGGVRELMSPMLKLLKIDHCPS
uniref:Rx N-terminal domain-containing protein n=1 Tax=Oryza barthii TaxID=65489 RepID=A0A0D3F134_9ORYZ